MVTSDTRIITSHTNLDKEYIYCAMLSNANWWPQNVVFRFCKCINVEKPKTGGVQT